MTPHDGKNDIPVIRMPRARNGESCMDLRVLQCDQVREKTMRHHHRFEFHALIVITKGSGDFRCNDGPTYPVLAGDMFYLRPEAVFDYGPQNGDTWDEYHCCIDGQRLHTWQERGWLPKHDMVWRLPTAESLTSLFRKVATFNNSQTFGDQDRAIITAEQLFCEAFHLRKNQHQQHDHLVSGCLAYCQQRLDQSLRFTDIADELGVSYSLLRQRIRNATGMSPAKLLLQIRCHHAQELLQEPEMTIANIAEQCGFEDPYTFSRSFKRAVGIAPSHWREQVIQWHGRKKRKERV